MFALKAHICSGDSVFSVSFINMVALITYALSQPSALEQIYSLATGVVGMVSTASILFAKPFIQLAPC